MKPQNPKAKKTLGVAKSAPPPNFDTMDAMGRLARTGFVQDQASAIVGVVRDAQRELATKADLDQAISGLKAEMEAVKFELRADMKEQDSKVERQFTRLYRQLWISMGMTITAITGILGMMIIFSG